MKTKITLSLTGILVSLLTPLAVLVPQASAAADICTWTGLGTGVEDVPNKTWTYQLTDAANWTGCDVGVVPESGDSLVFPANLADVDPTDANTNDSEWKYVVNNSNVGMTLAGIDFNGNTGADCTVYDDRYIIAGEGIDLSGDVSYSATGSCAGQYGHFPALDMTIITTTDVSLTVDLQDLVAPLTGNTLEYAAHALSFCDVSDTSRLSRYPSINTKITGTGVITYACQANWYPSTLDTFGDVVVETNVSLGGSPSVLGASATRTFTFKAGATFNLYGYLDADKEFKSNIVFVGAGSTAGYCKSVDCSGDDYVQVPGYRGQVNNNSYDSDTKKTTYFGLNFTGDITLSSNTVFRTYSDMTISGALEGDYTVSAIQGSRGKITVDASDNQSATPNGVIESERYDYALKDNGFDVEINFGQNGVLKEDEEIAHMVIVLEGATLKGAGKVAGIDVRAGGTLAPGNSPGCIVSNGDLTLAGSYDVEIAGTTACTEHDQTDVTGAVDVTGGTLDLSILNSFVPKLNDTFVIIKNDAADAVTGTFTGLVEGASIVKGSVTYQISYKGGDGNDVVLTATAVPATVTTPATGIGEIMQSPIMTLVAVILSAGMLVGIKRIQSAK